MTLPKDHLPDDAEAQRREQADPLVAAVIRTADDAGLTCPDAEVLGLYAERDLVGDEQAAVSAHVGSCARCQATLQAIERAMPDAAGTAGAAEAGDAALPAGWFGGWRWLVPVTSLAAAAVVAVWLGQGRAPESTVSQATDALSDALPRAADAPAASAELAREAPVTAPSGPAARQSPEATPPPPAGVAAPGGARPAPVEPPPSPASGSTAPDASAVRDRARAGGRVDRPTARGNAERRQVVGGLSAADTLAASAADSVAASAADSAAASAAGSTAASTALPAAPSAASQAADSSAAGTATPAAAPPARAAALAEDAAQPANEQPASKETAPRAAKGTGGRATVEEAPAMPAWRVREGSLERTRDGGRTWQRVALPTTERIARVVERPRGTVTVVTVAGTRLVSTDSGSTWRRP